MDTIADAVYVLGVSRVPERGVVAKMGAGGEEELECYIRGRRRVGEEGMRLVVRCDLGAEVGEIFFWRPIELAT